MVLLMVDLAAAVLFCLVAGAAADGAWLISFLVPEKCWNFHVLPPFNTTNSCLSNEPMLDADEQKKNKNHF